MFTLDCIQHLEKDKATVPPDRYGKRFIDVFTNRAFRPSDTLQTNVFMPETNGRETAYDPRKAFWFNAF